jgi:Acetyltransferase (GNAT) domain
MESFRYEYLRARPDPENGVLADILSGFRFTLCAGPGAAARALEVRRRVYIDSAGYALPVPDEFDRRSWLLLAEDVRTGEPVGTMRLTPRSAGPLELEEYFDLPSWLRTPKAVELNRFAILPAYRKGKTFLPVVSLGLFKLVYDFLRRIDAHYMVVASKPERTWTYRWLLFESTGQRCPYGKLAGSEHELLWHDFRQQATLVQTHPFRDLFLGRYGEVLMPARTPRLGIGGAHAEPLRFAMGA